MVWSTLRAIVAHFLGHRLWRLLGNCAIEMEVVAEAAAEQGDDGHAARLPQDVPGRDVDAGLRVRVSLECLVHRAIEQGRVTRIETDQTGRDLGQTGSHALRVGRQVGGPKRTDLPMTHDAFVGLDTNHRTIEDVDRVPARPRIAALVQGEFDAVGRIRVIFMVKAYRSSGRQPRGRESQGTQQLDWTNASCDSQGRPERGGTDHDRGENAHDIDLRFRRPRPRNPGDHDLRGLEPHPDSRNPTEEHRQAKRREEGAFDL